MNILKKFLVFGVLTLILAFLGIFGYRAYENNVVSQQIDAVIKQDDFLLGGILNVENVAPNITFEELLQKLQINKEKRQALRDKLQILNVDVHQGKIAVCVNLLNVEDEFIRAEETRARALLSYTISKNAYVEADTRAKAALKRFISRNPDPYSDSDTERRAASDPNYYSYHSLGASQTVAIEYEISGDQKREFGKDSITLRESIRKALTTLDTIKQTNSAHPNLSRERNLDAQIISKKEIYEEALVKAEEDKVTYSLAGWGD